MALHWWCWENWRWVLPLKARARSEKICRPLCWTLRGPASMRWGEVVSYVYDEREERTNQVVLSQAKQTVPTRPASDDLDKLFPWPCPILTRSSRTSSLYQSLLQHLPRFKTDNPPLWHIFSGHPLPSRLVVHIHMFVALFTQSAPPHTR